MVKFLFSVHTITEAKQSNRQGDLPARSFDLARPGVALPLNSDSRSAVTNISFKEDNKNARKHIITKLQTGLQFSRHSAYGRDRNHIHSDQTPELLSRSFPSSLFPLQQFSTPCILVQPSCTLCHYEEFLI